MRYRGFRALPFPSIQTRLHLLTLRCLVSNSDSFPSNQFSCAEILTLFRTNQYAMIKR